MEKETTGPNITMTEWGLVLGAAVLVDLVQVGLDLLVIGIVANRLIDIWMVMSIFYYCKIRGVTLTWPRVLSICAAFSAELIPLVDVAPFWAADVGYIILSVEAEKLAQKAGIIGKITKGLIQSKMRKKNASPATEGAAATTTASSAASNTGADLAGVAFRNGKITMGSGNSTTSNGGSDKSDAPSPHVLDLRSDSVGEVGTSGTYTSNATAENSRDSEESEMKNVYAEFAKAAMARNTALKDAKISGPEYTESSKYREIMKKYEIAKENIQNTQRRSSLRE